MGDVYSITGFFKHSGNLSPFGGFLYGEPHDLHGLLNDHLGPSSVSGAFSRDGKKLVLFKRYHGKEEMILHQFDKNAEGVWMGAYCLEGVVEEAFCRVEVNWRGLDIKTRVQPRQN